MIGSASMSARSATAGGSSASPPMSAMIPVPFGKIAGSQADALEQHRDPAGRAVLGVPDLGMGVQIPAELDQL